MNTRKPTHPGAVVKHDVLEPLGISITDAAKMLDYSRKQLSAFLNGRARCTVELAVKLGKATGTSAQSWLNMQMACDLWEASESQLGQGIRPFPQVKSAAS